MNEISHRTITSVGLFLKFPNIEKRGFSLPSVDLIITWDDMGTMKVIRIT